MIANSKIHATSTHSQQQTQLLQLQEIAAAPYARVAYQQLLEPQQGGGGGPPSPPLAFPAPHVYPAVTIVQTNSNNSNSNSKHNNFFVMDSAEDDDEGVVVDKKQKKTMSLLLASNSEKSLGRAYALPGITLATTLCGEIRLCRVLEEWHDSKENRNISSSENSESNNTTPPPPNTNTNNNRVMYYKTTKEHMVIKMDRRATMKHLHSTNMAHPIAENPWKEVAALQFLAKCSTSPHVVSLLQVMADENYLYEVMPHYHCSLDAIVQRHPQGLDEDLARHYFGQILLALHHLHSHGVCHLDISTRNILVNDDDDVCDDNNNNDCHRCVLIDFGLSLRVPYSYPDDACGQDVTDCGAAATGTMTTATTTRRIIHSQEHGGKLRFMAPEMYHMQDFDGLAVDLWSSGVVLFVMLTGRCPYLKPDDQCDAGFHDLMDDSYYWNPQCVPQIMSWGRTVSPEAVDLVHGLLRADPRQRSTLAQVAQHPWLQKRILSMGHISF